MYKFYVTACTIISDDNVVRSEASSQDDAQEKGKTLFCYLYFEKNILYKWKIISLKFNTKCIFLFTDSFRWPHEAILLLFNIYKDNEHLVTSGKMTHKKFWELISSQLNTKGYVVNGVQCKSKMAGLKNTFKNVKDHNAKSGNSKRTWKYFDVSTIFIF